MSVVPAKVRRFLGAEVVSGCEPLDMGAGRGAQVLCTNFIFNDFNSLVTNELEHIFITTIYILMQIYNFTYFCVCVRERGLTI